MVRRGSCFRARHGAGASARWQRCIRCGRVCRKQPRLRGRTGCRAAPPDDPIRCRGQKPQERSPANDRALPDARTQSGAGRQPERWRWVEVHEGSTQPPYRVAKRLPGKTVQTGSRAPRSGPERRSHRPLPGVVQTLKDTMTPGAPPYRAIGAATGPKPATHAGTSGDPGLQSARETLKRNHMPGRPCGAPSSDGVARERGPREANTGDAAGAWQVRIARRRLASVGSVVGGMLGT